MSKVKTSALTGTALDWAAAKCEDLHTGIDGFWSTAVLEREENPFKYSTDWSLGGPIIQREKISIRQWTNVPVVHAYMPVDGADWSSDGESPLIAAMRCYCCAKLGDIIDVPEELCPQQSS